MRKYDVWTNANCLRKALLLCCAEDDAHDMFRLHKTGDLTKTIKKPVKL